MMDRIVAIETEVETLKDQNTAKDHKIKILETKLAVQSLETSSNFNHFSDFGTRVQCKVGFQGPNCETCAHGYFNFPTCAGMY